MTYPTLSAEAELRDDAWEALYTDWGAPGNPSYFSVPGDWGNERRTLDGFLAAYLEDEQA